MKTALALLLFLLSAGCLVLTSRALLCNTRRWWQNKDRPVILASPGELTAMPPRWPARGKRWPAPYTGNEITMDEVTCDAYSRSAAHLARQSAFRGESLLVVGGAFLGVQLLPLSEALLESALRPRDLTNPLSILSALPWSAGWLSLLGLVVLIIGVNDKDDSAFWSRLSDLYKRAGVAASTQVAPPMPPQTQESSGSWRSRLAKMFRN